MRKLGIKIVAVGQLVSRRHMSSSDLLVGYWSNGSRLKMWEVEWVLCHSDCKHLRQRLLAEINLYQFCESERYGTSDCECWALLSLLMLRKSTVRWQPFHFSQDSDAGWVIETALIDWMAEVGGRTFGGNCTDGCMNKKRIVKKLRCRGKEFWKGF